MDLEQKGDCDPPSGFSLEFWKLRKSPDGAIEGRLEQVRPMQEYSLNGSGDTNQIDAAAEFRRSVQNKSIVCNDSDIRIAGTLFRFARAMLQPYLFELFMRSIIKDLKLISLDIVGISILLVLSAVTLSNTPVGVPPGFLNSDSPKTTDDENHAVDIDRPVFSDRTLDADLFFSHQQGDEQLAGIDESLGAGACAADFNGDGLVDLFLVNGSGQTRYYGKAYWWQQNQGNALFLNTGDGRFRNATADAGLEQTLWGMGCLAADFDNDGNSDLLVTAKQGNFLYRNTGGGKFAEVTAVSGLTDNGWSTSAAAADFNRDGLLDIYVGRFIEFEKGKKTYEANSQFVAEKKGTFDASLYPALPNRLYVNQGGFKFKEVAAEFGVQGADGRTLDVSWHDLDGDGWPDLLVSNDKGTGSNSAYLNRNGKRFESAGQTLGLRSALGSRGIGAGDLNGDGRAELLLASPSGENTLALFWQADRDGSLGFLDRSRELGIGSDAFLNVSGWSPLVRDFNNDGFEDVVLAAGHLEPDPDTARLSQGQPKQFWLNDTRGQFVSANSGSAFFDQTSARGAVAADFDNDGDIDLYFTQNNELGQYLRNDSQARHWLGLKLQGQRSNRDGLGAIVHAYTATGRQTKTLVSGEGFLSDSDKRLLFGLGPNPSVEKVVVEWPDGGRQVVYPKQVDRYWLVDQDQSELQPLDAKLARDAKALLPMALGGGQPALRARCLRMTKDILSDEDFFRELREALADSEPEVRKAAIQLATEAANPRGLAVLVRGLDDSEPENAVAAIAGLRAMEDEASVRWLLGAFNRDSVEVKVALADTFGYFFREEEAVVYRKYLAVPYLIRLLDDISPQVRGAAARALADAERFRGVHALLDRLDDSDVSARGELVRAVGLIRQTEALPKLNALLADDKQPAYVIARLFVAAKRLGDVDAPAKLTNFLDGSGAFRDRPLAQRLAVLNELLVLGDDAAVFDGGPLRQKALDLFSRFKPADIGQRLAWISIWQHYDDPHVRSWLWEQLKAKEPEVRASAYRALSVKAEGATNELSRQAWRDVDPAIREWALGEMLARNADFREEELRTLIEDPVLRGQALRSWSAHGISSPNRLLAVLSAQNTGSQSTPSLTAVCFTADAAFKEFCPVLIYAGETSPDKREAARRMLLDTTLDLTLREAVLKRYTTEFDPDALNQLYAAAQNKKDPLRPALLEKLFSFNDDSLVEFARKIAGSANEQDDLRLSGVEFLLKRNDPSAKMLIFGQGSEGKS
ncbi:FG-GAP-like repeat-containing protein [Methylomonas sp. HW2-6]|uniref:FG-GAP-like repeat-containing protein n=1 Tax=Methylomonas sp. HW2-6 TaxID=3376687 RepID=UPI0040410083